MPVERRRSISAQSGGAEHVISVPVSFSTQRKAGMSSLDPSRIPAWLAPVCEERSVSHSVRPVRVVGQPARHRRGVAVAHRAAQHRQRQPVDLEEHDPGDVGRAMMPWRRAIRCAIRIDPMSSVPSRTASTTLTAATTSAAEQRPAEAVDAQDAVGQGVGQRAGCRRRRTARAGSPRTSVSGSRSAASTGGMTAFSAATIAATSSAPR